MYNGGVGYSLNVNAYTTVIDELQDFQSIYAGDSWTVVKGSFILAKDILEPNTVLTMPAGKVANDFGGTFDGRGHVLSFTLDHGTTQRFGLFGECLEGAIIKNVAFNHITKTATASSNPAGLICFEGIRKGSSAESVLENIFIDLKFTGMGKSYMTLMHNVSWTTAIKNVIIHVPTVPQGEPCGAFARGSCTTVNNSYIISTATNYADAEMSAPHSSWIQPTSYVSYAQMKAAGNKYTTFSSEYWDTTTYGVPVWKALVADFTM